MSDQINGLSPGFVQRLASPAIRTVLLWGCGGGFDFVHSLMLWPELRRMGKRVVVGSYSFGDPKKIEQAQTVFESGAVVARRVTARAVSLTAVADLPGLKEKLLITTGLGADRFNHVSDASTLRAIAELTRSGGFLGALGLEPAGEPVRFYRALLQFLDERHAFRSIVSASVLAAAEGHYGSEVIPPSLKGRVQPRELYLWPLMAMLFGFEVDKVVARSLFPKWIRNAPTVVECYSAIHAARQAMPLRPVEHLPRHEDYRNPNGRFI